jgi:hypothetical protein
MITESDQLADALREAGHLWPDLRDDRGALVRRILGAGIETILSQRDERESARRGAIHQIAGSMTGIWPRDWRQELLDEWPT